MASSNLPGQHLPGQRSLLSRAGDAVQLVLTTPGFQQIIVANRSHNDWTRSRNALAQVGPPFGEHIIYLARQPPTEANQMLCRALFGVISAPGMQHPHLAELLRIYCNGELPFFISLQKFTDADFFDCRDFVITKARRESALQRLNNPEPSAASSSLLPAFPNHNTGNTSVRDSNDSGYDSRHQSLDQVGCNTNPATPLTAASPQSDLASQYQPGGYNAIAYSPAGSFHGPSQYPTGSNTTQTANGRFYHCPICDNQRYTLNRQGLGRWKDHMLNEHNERISWKCCGKCGKKMSSYLTHHQAVHSECDSGNCSHQSGITITRPGRDICICVNCDPNVSFEGSERYENLVEHWARAHVDRIENNTLDTGLPRFHSYGASHVGNPRLHQSSDAQHNTGERRFQPPSQHPMQQDSRATTTMASAHQNSASNHHQVGGTHMTPNVGGAASPPTNFQGNSARNSYRMNEVLDYYTTAGPPGSS